MKSSKIFLGLATIVALALSGCSSADGGSVFTPPGAHLGDQIVDPPAALPAKMDSKPASSDDFDYSICNAIVSVDPLAVENMNRSSKTNPPKNPSIKGAAIASAKQMSVDSAYPNIFSYLVKAESTSGEVFWFGSNGNLNESEVSDRISLEVQNNPIFGADENTQENFLWGAHQKNNTDFMSNVKNTLARYSTCFEPRQGEVPTESKVLSPEAAVALVKSARSMRAVDLRLNDLVGQQFRWNENLSLVDNGRYGSYLRSKTAVGLDICLSDFVTNGSVLESRVVVDGVVTVDFVLFPNVDCTEPSVYAIGGKDDGSNTSFSAGNAEAKGYVDAFTAAFSNSRF